MIVTVYDRRMVILGQTAVKLPLPSRSASHTHLVLAVSDDDECVKPDRIIVNGHVAVVHFSTPFTGNVWVC